MIYKYKSQNMRSMLETRTATVLDHLRIKWKYEPYSLQLETGEVYLPDFVINKNLIIECKGGIDKKEIDFHTQVCEQYQTDIILINYNELYFLEYWAENEDGKPLVTVLKLPDDADLCLINCPKCVSFSFVNSWGMYGCNNCNKYGSGDHHIVETYSVNGLSRLYNKLGLRHYKPSKY